MNIPFTKLLDRRSLTDNSERRDSVVVPSMMTELDPKKTEFARKEGKTDGHKFLTCIKKIRSPRVADTQH